MTPTDIEWIPFFQQLLRRTHIGNENINDAFSPFLGEVCTVASNDDDRAMYERFPQTGHEIHS